MRAKEKVCFFVTALDSGGLENYLLRFLRHSGNCFSEIIVFCKGGKGGQLADLFQELPNINIVKKNISYYNIFHYFQIVNFFRNNKIDVVCDFTGNFAGLILLCAKIAKIKKRVSFYRGSSNHFDETFLKLLYDKLVRRCTLLYATDILANSNAALNFFFAKEIRNDDRFQVIYNGLNAQSFLEERDDLRQELKIPQGAFVVGHVGRFNSAKNHTTIIKVAAILCQQYPDIFFLLCGNGVKDNLASQLAQEEMRSQLILLNNRTDIPKILNTFDCFYFPSITEGQPNALIEAMIKNLPIVSSNIESIKESVPREFIKELVDPLSTDQAIDKILGIYHKRNIVLLGDWAVKRYNHDILFTRFLNVLRGT